MNGSFMNRRLKPYFFGMLVLAFTSISSIVSAAVEPLLQSSTSWDGGEISYPKGKAEVTAMKLTLAENEDVPFHCHPVPTFGYIASGAVEVVTKNGDKTILREGDVAIEVMNTVHKGIAIEGPLEIIVFYAGAEGIKTTLKPEEGCR